MDRVHGREKDRKASLDIIFAIELAPSYKTVYWAIAGHSASPYAIFTNFTVEGPVLCGPFPNKHQW